VREAGGGGQVRVVMLGGNGGGSVAVLELPQGEKGGEGRRQSIK